MAESREHQPFQATEASFYKLVETIVDRIVDDDKVHENAPGLKDLLQDVLDDRERSDEEQKADHIGFLRRLLHMYKAAPHDNAYQNVVARYTEAEQERIEKFVDGASVTEIDEGFEMGPTLGVRDEICKLMDCKVMHIAGQKLNFLELLKEEFQAHNPFHRFVDELNTYLRHEEQDAAVTVFHKAEFQNWGLNVNNKPRWTCIPTTVASIQAIVRFAKQAEINVRCAGYRHSWSPIFGNDGEILISALPLDQVAKLPNFLALEVKEPPPNGLQDISIVNGQTRKAGNKLVRIGCAVTNQRLRQWCVQGNEVTIPANVILVETTVVGVNQPICHGAGLSHPSLSDLVRKIEYVDVNGDLQEITDPKHLLAAGGAFGLYGVITYVTLEFAPMSYAMMHPAKLPVMQAIPPPKSLPDSAIPKSLFISATPEERVRWQAEFERNATDSYYCEWFWFPYLDQTYVNCWSTTDDPSDAVDFPMYGKIILSFIGGVLFNVAQQATTLGWVGELIQTYALSTTLISHAAMALLPTTRAKTWLPNALHFQRSIQNSRVCDVEVEMPLQPRCDDATKIDFEYVQRAWWDAILLAYKHEQTAPMRMPLEMRLMGGSDVILAPQRGNKLGTCSIEALTLESEREAWHPFAQELIDIWTAYRDVEGKRLNTRPHWAKEWYDFNVDGRPWVEKLREDTYRDEIVEFKAVLADIGREHGWTLDQIKQRFGNDMLNRLIYDPPSSSTLR